MIEKGMNIVGVPKTIDQDLGATDYTFGFNTAVQCATDAIDRLQDTAASHDRVMIMEVMGRDAGFIALYTAMAGGAQRVSVGRIATINVWYVDPPGWGHDCSIGDLCLRSRR